MTYLSPYNTRRNAFELPSSFGSLEKQLDSLFSGLPGLFDLSNVASKTVAESPLKLRWYEKEDAYQVRLDLPGVSKEDISLEIEEGLLQVTAVRKFNSSGNEADNSQELRKSVRLPEDVNEEAISATVENGVLSVNLPKSEKAQPRKISIK